MNYGSWIIAVNKILIGQIGMSINDLEDWAWRIAFDSESTPKQAICDFFEEIYPEYQDVVDILRE